VAQDTKKMTPKWHKTPAGKRAKNVKMGKIDPKNGQNRPIGDKFSRESLEEFLKIFSESYNLLQYRKLC